MCRACDLLHALLRVHDLRQPVGADAPYQSRWRMAADNSFQADCDDALLPMHFLSQVRASAVSFP